ncbi:MAG: hypothetical protein U9Q23_02655 [Candidatus Bipolaricaulota bacterium]|nr:hypothetical protein [Candidatus Bipolaricaulota bacterium]
MTILQFSLYSENTMKQARRLICVLMAALIPLTAMVVTTGAVVVPTISLYMGF